ncbi:ParA family protein, partial [Endozoicomonas sp. ONNA1]|uniref:ParA family protein n=1 Tax=Endozoicomonas sp. ONNA1 TaxID=2828740 RepID=UPI0021477A16
MTFPFVESPVQKAIALTNQKGGVGKSTLVLQKAFFLAEADKRVLVVDMDGQQNVTQALLEGNLGLIAGSLTSHDLFQNDIAGLEPLKLHEELHLIASTEELHDVEASPLECSKNPAKHL